MHLSAVYLWTLFVSKNNTLQMFFVLSNCSICWIWCLQVVVITIVTAPGRFSCPNDCSLSSKDLLWGFAAKGMFFHVLSEWDGLHTRQFVSHFEWSFCIVPTVIELFRFSGGRMRFPSSVCWLLSCSSSKSEMSCKSLLKLLPMHINAPRCSFFSP